MSGKMMSLLTDHFLMDVLEDRSDSSFRFYLQEKNLDTSTLVTSVESVSCLLHVILYP